MSQALPCLQVSLPCMDACMPSCSTDLPHPALGRPSTRRLSSAPHMGPAVQRRQTLQGQQHLQGMRSMLPRLVGTLRVCSPVPVPCRAPRATSLPRGRPVEQHSRGSNRTRRLACRQSRLSRRQLLLPSRRPSMSRLSQQLLSWAWRAAWAAPRSPPAARGQCSRGRLTDR